MKKKSIPALLLVMMFLITATHSSAATKWTAGQSKTINSITYTMLQDGTLGVENANITGKNKSVKIPGTVKGYKVSTIMSFALSYDGPLNSVVIPEGVTTVENLIFGGGSSKNVSFPSTLTNVDKDAFIHHQFTKIQVSSKNPVLGVKDGCLYNKQTGHLYCYTSLSKQKKLVLPDEITDLSGIESNVNLETITLSPNLKQMTSIGGKELKTIIIPKDMTSLPAGFASSWFVQYFDQKQPARLSTAVELENGNTAVSVIDGAIIDNSKNELVLYIPQAGISQYTIPDHITSIGSYAFCNCPDLTSVSLPASLITIGANAFAYCTNLESIELPDSLQSIGASAFAWCENLKAIEIPNSVQRIGDSAFERCRNIQAITIPESVTSIGNMKANTYNITFTVNENSAAHKSLKGQGVHLNVIPAEEKQETEPEQKAQEPEITAIVSTPTPTDTPVSTSNTAKLESLYNLANQIAGLISYPSGMPASGTTETVVIKGRSYQIHSDFKYAMDVYYEFYNQYYTATKNMDFVRMLALLDQAEKVDKAMEKVDDLELSEGDLAYYMDIYVKMLKLISAIN